MRALLVSLVLVACGSKEISPTYEAGTGGAPVASGGTVTAATGGTVQVSTGGTTVEPVTTATELGGALGTGGSVATGGAAVVLSATGGTMLGTGGAATGGVSTGGVATGGVGAGGRAATGGAATGGNVATGGAATGGSPPRCPVGVTGAEYTDANGQCWSRTGLAHVTTLSVPRNGTLIGYRTDVSSALAVLGPLHASLGCETKVVLLANGTPYWCGFRMVSSAGVEIDWRTQDTYGDLAQLNQEFWTLSIEEVNSGACVSRC